MSWRNRLYYIINLYSSCNIINKKMWCEIKDLKNKSIDGELCLGGEFNSVVSSNERKRSKGYGRRS